MRIRPNFGIIGQIQPNTNASTGTVKTTADYINNIVTSVGISIGSGGITTTAGDYQIITFTGSGSFTPSQTGNVELMLIGGGGGGVSTSSSSVSPGASAGGMIYYGSQIYPYRAGTLITLAAGITYTVTIGGGGATATGGTAGGNSSLVGGDINLIAYGGARAPAGSEFSGGCGGGYWGTASHLTGNAAPNQGYPGSSSAGGAAITYYAEVGGAGLGGMAPGIAVQNYTGTYNNDYSRGAGGIGFYTDISGTLSYYGAGGNGGLKFFNSTNAISANSQPGGGGTAPGSTGAVYISAVNALPNTGSGGAGGALNASGGSWYSGSAGGSGILIIRYKFQ